MFYKNFSPLSKAKKKHKINKNDNELYLDLGFVYDTYTPACSSILVVVKHDNALQMGSTYSEIQNVLRIYFLATNYN